MTHGFLFLDHDALAASLLVRFLVGILVYDVTRPRLSALSIATAAFASGATSVLV
jgi:hypothetical protein